MIELKKAIEKNDFGKLGLDENMNLILETYI